MSDKVKINWLPCLATMNSGQEKENAKELKVQNGFSKYTI